jgi:hypothetical protein
MFLRNDGIHLQYYKHHSPENCSLNIRYINLWYSKNCHLQCRTCLQKLYRFLFWACSRVNIFKLIALRYFVSLFRSAICSSSGLCVHKSFVL